MLTQRHNDILRLVVETHLALGEPVGSQTLRARNGLALSTATIRNVLAELDEMGLLSQPHKSAGRIPTAQGLRSYVETLREYGPLNEEAKARIRQACEEGEETLDSTLERASREVAKLTRQACLVRSPDLNNAVIERIQFVGLDGSGGAFNRILALLVSHSGQLRNRILVLEDRHTQTELEALGRSLSRRLRGATLGQARQRLGEEIERGRRRCRELLQKLLLSVHSDAGGLTGGLIVNGQLNLLPDAHERPSSGMREILAALEEKRKLTDLLDHCLLGDGVQLFIGAESAMVGGDDCAMIASKFVGPESRLMGSLAVVGPSCLDYAYIIPLVDYAARALSDRWAQPRDGATPETTLPEAGKPAGSAGGKSA